MPFWWYYPPGLRQAFIDRWRPELAEWTELVEGTRLVTREALEEYFPDAEIMAERALGLLKSHTAYKCIR